MLYKFVAFTHRGNGNILPRQHDNNVTNC